MLLCTRADLFSCVQLFATSWAVACQTDPMEFSRQIQERVAIPLQGIFPTQGSNLHFLHALHW